MKRLVITRLMLKDKWVEAGILTNADLLNARYFTVKDLDSGQVVHFNRFLDMHQHFGDYQPFTLWSEAELEMLNYVSSPKRGIFHSFDIKYTVEKIYPDGYSFEFSGVGICNMNIFNLLIRDGIANYLVSDRRGRVYIYLPISWNKVIYWKVLNLEGLRSAITRAKMVGLY